MKPSTGTSSSSTEIWTEGGEMIETALVFDLEGKTIHWHLPAGRSAGSLPDSVSLWDVLWENRHRLGGVAHTHPWDGPSGPSHTDVTTFAAVEAALGKRLVWPIVTFTHITYVEWVGPGRIDYEMLRTPSWRVADVEELRNRSR